MFHCVKGIKVNNKIIEIKNLPKLVQFIIHFNSFCIMKHILTNMIFSKNTFLLQKFENKTSSHTFTMKETPSVFDKVKLAVYGSENA